MIRIVLNDEQSQAVRDATERVELRDADGALLGYVAAPAVYVSPERLAEAERRLKSNGPWYTREQVREHLKSLEQSLDNK